MIALGIISLSKAYENTRSALLDLCRKSGLKKTAVYGSEIEAFCTAALLYDTEYQPLFSFGTKQSSCSSLAPFCSADFVPAEIDGVFITEENKQSEIFAEKCINAGIKVFRISRDYSVDPFYKEFMLNRQKMSVSLPSAPNRISVWGCGLNGWTCVLILLSLGLPIYRLYDAKFGRKLFGIDVSPEPEYPEKDELLLIAINNELNIVSSIRRKCSLAGASSIHVINSSTAATELLREELHRKEPRRSFEEIKEMILGNETELISFDIFDTLLVRPVCAPKDLFFIIEQKVRRLPKMQDFPFRNLRIISEREARSDLKNRHGASAEDVTFDEIYEYLARNAALEPSLADKIKQIEYETELKYLYPRKSGQELFQLAKESGKKIILISDIYFPSHLMEKILAEKGYEGYAACEISAEYRLLKVTGSLFKKLREKYTLDSSKWLHLGDNIISDIQRPSEQGIKTVYLPRTFVLFMEDKANSEMWGAYLDGLEFSFRITLGIIANRYFDNPFTQEKAYEHSLFKSDPEMFGYYACGPWAFFMVKWLGDRLIKDSCTKIHFIARDGYIPIQIYETIKKYKPNLPHGEYLHTSRVVSHTAGFRHQWGVRLAHSELPAAPGTTVDKLLREKFFIENTNEISEALAEMGCPLNSTHYDFNIFIKSMLKNPDLENVLTRNVNKQLELIRKYYNTKLPLGEKHAIFDIGYTGKLQASLEWAAEVKTMGYYFTTTLLRNITEEDSLSMKGWLGSPENEIISGLYKVIPEIIISDPYSGSLIGFKENQGSPEAVFADPQADKHTVAVLESIQRGILSFTKELTELFEEDIDILNLAANTAFFMLKQYCAAPYPKDALLFDGVRFENVPTRNDGFILSTKGGLSSWKEGYEAASRLANNQENLKYNDAKPKTPDNISEKILWVDYAQVPEKYDFILEAAKSSPSSCYILLDGCASHPEICQDNLIIIKAPESAVRYQNVQEAPIFQNDRHVNAALQAYAAQHMYMIGENSDINYEQALAVVTNAYGFTIRLLKDYNPDLVLIWNEFYSLSKATELACKIMGKRSVYMEFGVLPGTMQIDIAGQTGTSAIAQDTDLFNSLEIDETDCEKALEALEAIKAGGLNRKKQPPKGELSKLVKGIDKKLIFVAGHNDYSSGVFPYDGNARRNYSPIYKDSKELFYDMAQRAEDNGWFMVFKPHPYAKKYLPATLRTEHYLIVDKVNVDECIDICDITLTVLSQISYMALIRDKPLVMLGYSQLKGKGCCYEAFDEKSIDKKIGEALAKGYTNEQKHNFLLHTARLLKYYLFAQSKDMASVLHTQNISDFSFKTSELANNNMDDFELMKIKRPNKDTIRI